MDNIELDAATQMVYNCGHGQLRPNIVLIGYKSDWLNCPQQDVQDFLNVFKYIISRRFTTMYYYNFTRLLLFKYKSRFSVANMNGIATIMVRVSSAETFENQSLFIQDFKHLCNQEKVSFENISNQNEPLNVQK